VTVKLSTPRLRVVLDEDATEADVLTVQTTNVDLVLAERTGRRHKWGPISESPLAYQTFLAWAALRRRGLIADAVTFEAFESEAVSISAVDDDDEADPGTPTGPDHGSG
jgi:hypothetical protein